jgi:hypothetical protein
LLGAALIYLDIDHFKAVNTKLTERVVDKTLLPQFQRLVWNAAAGHGFAYDEGVDITGERKVVQLGPRVRTVSVLDRTTPSVRVRASRPVTRSRF